jgi:hypothetical protein
MIKEIYFLITFCILSHIICLKIKMSIIHIKFFNANKHVNISINLFSLVEYTKHLFTHYNYKILTIFLLVALWGFFFSIYICFSGIFLINILVQISCTNFIHIIIQ